MNYVPCDVFNAMDIGMSVILLQFGSDSAVHIEGLPIILKWEYNIGIQYSTKIINQRGL